jgi:hypothetical protein
MPRPRIILLPPVLEDARGCSDFPHVNMGFVRFESCPEQVEFLRTVLRMAPRIMKAERTAQMNAAAANRNAGDDN